MSFRTLKASPVRLMVTIGQYLRPSLKHPAVKEYVHPMSSKGIMSMLLR